MAEQEENQIPETQEGVGGRPEKSDGEKENILKLIKPYLQQGLSLNKACLQAGLPKSTVYDLKVKDDEFSEKIDEYKDFLSIIANNAVLSQLHMVIKKQNLIDGQLDRAKDNPVEYLKIKGLSGGDVSFLQWFVTTNRSTKEEYSPRQDVEIVDTEAAIQKTRQMIDEAFNHIPSDE